MKRFLIVLLALLLVQAPADPARGHALQPGYLEITPVSGSAWQVLWRKPDVQGKPMGIKARLPATCQPTQTPAPAFDGSGWVARWIATCPDGITGSEIAIEGLEATATDVLVRYATEEGRSRSERLTPERSAFVISAEPGAWDVFGTYVPLGIEHILGGIDHLLFVFALLLLVTNRWRLLGAITSFTVAHSITMAAATLGWVALPGPPVEAVIALSIMFLASELLLRETGSERMSQRYPWLVSFAFGLLHGFGFAGALREIGLPPDDVPLALLSFNVGVEIGQLLFVAAVLLAWSVLRWLAPSALAALRAPHALVATISAYVIGGIAAYWFVERIAGFWT